MCNNLSKNLLFKNCGWIFQNKLCFTLTFDNNLRIINFITGLNVNTLLEQICYHHEAFSLLPGKLA